MDAYSSSSDLSYANSSPVLVAASSPSAMRRAETTIGASGLRVGAKLSIEEALARLKVQPSATAVWVELDRDCGGCMDDLVSQLSHDVSRGFYSAVVSVTAPLVDPISARMDEAGLEVLIEADEVERTAALALAVATRGTPLSLSDVARPQRGASPPVE